MRQSAHRPPPMMTDRLRPCRLPRRLCALACAAAATLAAAQSPPSGQTSATLGVLGVSQSKASLDGGGKAGWNGLGANVEVAHQFSPALSVRASAAYLSEEWRFDTPGAFGAQAPWGRIDRPSLGVNIGYASSADLAWFDWVLCRGGPGQLAQSRRFQLTFERNGWRVYKKSGPRGTREFMCPRV